ncbi:MAG: hypothetical protein AAGI17_06170 [Planctomycetota bacterium]
MSMTNENARTRHQARRGSVYIAALVFMAILAAIAITAAGTAGTGLRTSMTATNSRIAANISISGIELGLARLNAADRDSGGADTLPRLAFTPGQEVYELEVDELRYRISDSYDEDLTDDPTDPVLLQAFATVGDANWAETAIAIDDQGRPIEPLGSVLHAAEDLVITAGATVIADGAPLSTDKTLENNGVIVGDIEAARLEGSAPAGSIQTGVPRKGVADRNLFDQYMLRATELPFRGDVVGEVLGPGVNTYDESRGANDHGIYLIRTGGLDISIRRSRIVGTLIIDSSPGGQINFTLSNVFDPARPDAPAIMTRGATTFDISSNPLTEDGFRNFNPEGAPSGGETDSTLDDSYESGVNGLIYVYGNARFTSDGTFNGSALVDGRALITGRPRFVHDDMLLLAPPMGFGDDTEIGNMKLLPRSIERVTMP